eukprot:jgi/Bigna1/45886/estExt_Genewise1.C_10015
MASSSATPFALLALFGVAAFIAFSSSARLSSSISSSTRTAHFSATRPSQLSHLARLGCGGTRKLQVGADLKGQSFDGVDYRKFGSAYDGYRSILKKTRGLYGEEMKEYLDDGFQVIDVRPAYERERIRAKDSTHVPFVKEREGIDVMSLARRWSNSIYAGHSRDLERNDNFVADVQKEFPADAKLILSCGEGLRSLVATDYLVNAGFTNVMWLAGGMQRMPKGTMEVEGTNVDTGFARAGLDGGKIAGEIFDKVTSIRWWEMGKETTEKK